MPDHTLMPVYEMKPAPIMQRTNGFLVSLEHTCKMGGVLRQYEYFDEQADAWDAYNEPPEGWTALGMSACVDGQPVCRLDVAAMAAFRVETARDAKDDARHVRDYIGKASL